MLLGQLVDTDTAAIVAALAEAGVDVYRQTTVGDNEARIGDTLADAMRRSDIVVCAGGLGATVGDVPRDAIAAATGQPLELHEPSLRDIEAVFARLGRRMADNNRRQAMMPCGAQVMENPHGTAPGFIVEHAGRVIVALPGP